MADNDDLTRLRGEYARRAERLAGSDRYSLFNRANLFAVQQRQRRLLTALGQIGLRDLSTCSLLEVGCGGGGVLAEWSGLGVLPTRMAGVDLLFDRLQTAKCRLPVSGLANADGQFLPYASRQFDLVLQYTAFSSVLDNAIRRNLAAEMVRVLKPGGTIVWYDFWLNPTNPHTRGIRPGEIRSLFPRCACRIQKVTLAPPVARRVAPISWTAALILEDLRAFNSHYLALIRPALNIPA